MASAKAVLEKAVKLWNAGDEAGVLALGSPEVELTASGGLDFHGLDGLQQWYRLWDEACPDRVIRYHNVVGDEDQVIGEGTFTGTHTGVLHLPTGDVPPTGRRLKSDFVAVIRVSQDRITYMRHYLDVMDLMIQLGLIPAPAGA
jgi:predicted ester cyclase